jgi:hypothetical protein
LRKLSISASVKKFFLRVSTALSGLIGAFTTTYIQMAAFGQQFFTFRPKCYEPAKTPERNSVENAPFEA